MSRRETLLLTVSGPDGPGITARLMTVLGGHGVDVIDVEQVTVRHHLVLGLVVEAEAGTDLHEDLLLFGHEHGLNVEFERVDATPTDRGLGAVVTVLGSTVSPLQLAAVADSIASAGGNIDRIVRLARYPVTAYELTVLGAPLDALRPALVDTARSIGTDIAIQPDGLGRRAQRLVVLDVDSTLIQDEVIELLAEEAGVGDEVRRITERAMVGELDFEAALRERVRLLAGLDELALARARHRLRLTPGARTFVRTLHRLGFKVAIVSGGFTQFTEHLAAELEIDHQFANELEIRQGRLTGELVGEIVDRARKAELLRLVAHIEGIDVAQTVAVGDGANDLDMLSTAGLGVAFNAKQVVRDAADTSVSVPYLDAILFLLGVRRAEVEALDGSLAWPEGANPTQPDGTPPVLGRPPDLDER